MVLKGDGRKKLAPVPGKRALYAQVAELVDAADLESAGLSRSYGFESRPAHTLKLIISIQGVVLQSHNVR